MSGAATSDVSPAGVCIGKDERSPSTIALSTSIAVPWRIPSGKDISCDTSVQVLPLSRLSNAPKPCEL